MHSLRFTHDGSASGVRERAFTLGEVTGVLWSPESGADRAPVMLMGHPGGLHKKAPGLVARVRHYVIRYGFRAVAIDAPGHGGRPRTAEDERARAALRGAREAGVPLGPIIVAYSTALAERAVPEWRATMDALQALPEIGPAARFGYSGLTLATAIGLPLIAADSRIGAAVVGGVFVYDALAGAARRITIPIQYLVAWDDAEIHRQSNLDLFDAFASTEKTLHANPGGHHQVPRFETDDSARFFRRHLK